MKIVKITEDVLYFDNNNEITYDHDQDCCEWNHADFSQIDDLAKDHNFDENLKFEAVEGSGFRFGDNQLMVFVPCYSEQNGYYTEELDIYYNNKKVLHIKNCEFIEG